MSGSTLGHAQKASGATGATTVSIAINATRLGGYFLGNTANAAVSYLQIFDANATSAVTLGTTTPVLSLPLPANGSANLDLGDGIKFNNGIVIAFTTTRAGNTGPASTCDYNLWFSPVQYD